MFFSFIFFPKNIEARSGCCSYHGGVCGCGCCDGTSLSATCAPYYPECGGGGYGGYQAPPSCPSMSSYNSISDQCECYSGYIASGNSCISEDQACKNKYGYNSKSNYSGQCECGYGYTWNSSGTSCINQNQACQNQFGYNSKATISGDKCECKYGYVWNSAGTKCVNPDEVCQNKFGYNSKATTSGDNCECKYGYMWNKATTKCITKDAACQELNGLMSRSNLSGECECLSGYEYDGSKCIYKTKEIILPTPKPTKIPTPTIVKKEPTVIPTITTMQDDTLPKLNSNTKINPISNLFSKLFSWFFN